MKKGLKGFLLSLVAVPCALILTACGGSTGTQVYKSDFSTGNNNTFTNLYGAVAYNSTDKTVTLNKDANNQGANTYFGEDDKNTDWVDGGLTVSAKFKIVASSFNTGEGFNWTVALNNQEGTYISERSIYVRKYDNAVKVGYTYNGSSDELNYTATSNAEAKTLADGWYTFKFDFHTLSNNEVKVTISVVNSNNNIVFNTANAKLNKSDDSAVVLSEVKGIRYGWLSWMNVNSIECSEVSVFTNK